MTYRQLAAAMEQINIWEEALHELKSIFPHFKASSEEKDNHQAQINSIENALDQEIEE